jgi:hypothetical protein
MARTDDDDTRWPRQLLIGVGALLAVALVIGGVVSAVALGAAKVAGIGDVQSSATAKPSLYIPSGKPTTSIDAYPAPSGSASQSTGATPSGTPTATPTRKPKPLTLTAPQQVGANQRITLTGAYRGHDGVRLQVQRFEDGWVDFPVTATVRGGSYSTYITTSHTGVNRLRMADVVGATTSNVVRVTVG